MRKSILAVAGAAIVLALTSASATGISVGRGLSDSQRQINSVGATINYTANNCKRVDAVDYTYSSDKSSLTGITLSTTDAGCSGMNVDITVGGTAYGAQTSFSSGGTSYTASVIAPYELKSGVGNPVVITVGQPSV